MLLDSGARRHYKDVPSPAPILLDNHTKFIIFSISSNSLVRTVNLSTQADQMSNFYQIRMNKGLEDHIKIIIT